MAENAKALGDRPGGDKKSEQYQNHSYNCKNDFATDAGNNATYLTARIARDRPDILESMKKGSYRSVRAAAIAGKTRLLHVLTSGPDGCKIGHSILYTVKRVHNGANERGFVEIHGG